MGARTPPNRPTPRFGTDGVRGVANTELTPEYVLRIGRAAARVLGSPEVVIGRDPRRSSPLFDAALSAGFASEGVDVVSLGMLPTPAVAWRAATAGVAGVAGAVVTASHNPFGDNGVKLFAQGGRKLPDDVEAAIEAELDALDGHAVTGAGVGSITEDRSAADRYVGHLVASFPADLLAGSTIVVDGANGAMSYVAPAVLARLGAEVVALNTSPDGCNINDRCGATHTAPLVEAVRRRGADAGLAFDGDGDRVMAVDRTGAVIDGDRLMAVVAPSMRAAGALHRDAVVVTVMTNLGFRRSMAQQGIRVVETAVGDRYVLEALEREGLSLGGEQSGHVILRDRSTTGDGLLAGLVLLDTVRRSGLPIAGLADLAAAAMTSCPQVLVNVRTARRDAGAAGPVDEVVAAEIAAAQASLGEDGRVLVRASGTEPLVRVMVEAPTPEQAQQVADHLAAVIARAG